MRALWLSLLFRRHAAQSGLQRRLVKAVHRSHRAALRVGSNLDVALLPDKRPVLTVPDLLCATRARVDLSHSSLLRFGQNPRVRYHRTAADGPGGRWAFQRAGGHVEGPFGWKLRALVPWTCPQKLDRFEVEDFTSCDLVGLPLGRELPRGNLPRELCHQAHIRPSPLSEGELEGTTVTCPWHGAQFDAAAELGTATVTLR